MKTAAVVNTKSSDTAKPGNTSVHIANASAMNPTALDSTLDVTNFHEMNPEDNDNSKKKKSESSSKK